MPSQIIGLKNALIQKFSDLLDRVRAKLLAISGNKYPHNLYLSKILGLGKIIKKNLVSFLYNFFQGCRHFRHTKFPRAAPTLISDLSIFADDIESIRECTKSTGYRVVDVIHQKRDFEI